MSLTITEKLSEEQLRLAKDKFYLDAQKGIFPNDILGLICEKENIIDAIRKIKSNGGFKTAGVDFETGQEFLNKPTQQIFERIRKHLENYRPNMVKRVEIPKSNGKTRPLGIPTIVDRIIQTSIANIIEPILEAQMYEHSYGFRPLRKIEHAYGFIGSLTTNNQRHFIVEGDIKGYFDNINHNILINKLWKYGIRDKRVIMLIKKILKAGIQDVKDINNIGTPQGGTISTLLSNVYLTDFDHWVDKQWRNIPTNFDYKNQSHKTRALKGTNLKDGYLIRYADDWIIMTSSYENACKWKKTCETYLRKELKIELSAEKTLITDLREQKATFLGYDMFKVKGKNGNYTLRTAPNTERLEEKRKRLNELLKNMRRSNNHEELYKAMVLYNSTIRGLRNFYKNSTIVTPSFENLLYSKLYRQILQTAKKCNFKQDKLKNLVNLKHLEKNYGERKVWYFNFNGLKYGIEPITAVKYHQPMIKAQWITPYTAEGRSKWEEINKKSFTTLPRNIELTNLSTLNLIAKDSKIYTLEYFINRPMAFNRDKCKCRECGTPLTGYGDVNIHHLKPELDKDKINKLPNLVTLCIECHIEEHREKHRLKQIQKEKAKKVTKKNTIKTSTIKKPQKCTNKPTKEQLIQDIESMSMVKVGKKYGVSDNAVRNWCKNYEILDRAKNNRSAKTRTKSGQSVE